MGSNISRSLAVALAASALAGAAPGAPAPASAQTAARGDASLVQVGTGRGRLITLSRPMTDLFVADDKIADVQVRSPTQLYVFGKKAGETTVSATGAGGKVVFQANVRVGNNYDSLGSMLALAMPEAKIIATPMNGLVLLTGTVAAPEDAAQAEQLVQAFVGEGTKVLSRLKTATPLQVNLQVRIAEVSRSFIKNIGVNIASVDRTGGFKFGLGQGRNFTPQFSPGGPLGVGLTSGPTGSSLVNQPSTGSTLGLAGKLFGLDLLSAIDLGETTGQVTTLANPNLTALSGETASFLVGGEIPIPIAQALGAVTIDYKQYGISLAYTPVVLSDGRISLRVRPEVSQLVAEGSVQFNGTTIPGISTRRAETTLELGSGQSMMIGGLIQNSHNNSIDRTPGLGNLPILGALFRSNQFRRNESELVIIVTPYLVKPVNSQADLHLPTDGYRAPTDAERVLLGKMDGGKSGDRRPVPTVAPMPAPAAPVTGVVSPAAIAPTPQPARKTKGPAAPGFSE